MKLAEQIASLGGTSSRFEAAVARASSTSDPDSLCAERLSLIRRYSLEEIRKLGSASTDGSRGATPLPEPAG